MCITWVVQGKMCALKKLLKELLELLIWIKWQRRFCEKIEIEWEWEWGRVRERERENRVKQHWRCKDRFELNIKGNANGWFSSTKNGSLHYEIHHFGAAWYKFDRITAINRKWNKQIFEWMAYKLHVIVILSDMSHPHNKHFNLV